MNLKRMSLLFVACFVISACKDEQVNTGKASYEQTIIDKLVFVEGGTFMMGDVGYTDQNGNFRYFTGDRNTRPVHEVTLTSYSIQAYEVTMDDFDRYSKSIGEEMIAKDWRTEKHYGGDYPAKRMTWDQAQSYCIWLGNLIGYPMSLPTEAQWEYAARSRGKVVAHATNNGDIEYGVNYRDPKKGIFSRPVGSWPPNPLGIYDMSGNVSEWTVDWWYGYRKNPVVDPRNDSEIPKRSKHKIWRGSGAIGGKGQIQLYRRGADEKDNIGAGHGLRCAVNHPEKITQPNK